MIADAARKLTLIAVNMITPADLSPNRSLLRSMCPTQFAIMEKLAAAGLTEAGLHVSSPGSAGRTEPSIVPRNLTQDTPPALFELERF